MRDDDAATAAFFDSAAARRLDLRSNFPPLIERFVERERRMVRELAGSFDVLIEAACGTGRYLDLATQLGIQYHGIDIAPETIAIGRRRLAALGLDPERYRLTIGDAQRLALVLDADAGKRALLLFPFSAISNFASLGRFARSVAEAEAAGLVVTGYSTSTSMTEARVDYYRRCGFEDIRVAHSAQGVRVTAADGPSTMAYHSAVVADALARHGPVVETYSEGDTHFVCHRGLPADAVRAWGRGRGAHAE